MKLEREGSRYRLTVNVAQALNLQVQLATAIGRALRDQQPATESRAMADMTEAPKAYPSVFLLTVDGRVQSPASNSLHA